MDIYIVVRVWKTRLRLGLKTRSKTGDRDLDRKVGLPECRITTLTPSDRFVTGCDRLVTGLVSEPVTE